MSYCFSKSINTSKIEVIQSIYKHYCNLMFSVAYQILNDRFLAEDAVQISFYKLLHNKFEIDKIDCNRTKNFLVIIVRNVSIGIYNKKKKEVLCFEEDFVEVPDNNYLPIDIVINNEDANTIIKLLYSLEPQYSDIIRMKYYMEYSTKEIASIFDISEQLVRVRLFRGKKMLINLLKEYKYEYK